MKPTWIALAAALTGLVLLGPPATRAQNGPYQPVEPGPEDDIIATFDAEAGSNREYTFRWTFEPDERDDTIICQLNFDGDEVVEQSISDCDDTSTAQHRYDEPGTYRATLTVRSRDGGSDVAHVRVTVGE